MGQLCRCPWFVNTCKPEGECLCSDDCCNTGRWADDGDGHEDFTPDRNKCVCVAPK